MDIIVNLTPVHIIYLIGVITVLVTMIMRKDTPVICLLFLFLLGLFAKGNLSGGIQTVFSSIVYAAKEFMEIIVTIALITALSKCLADIGSDQLMIRSMSKIMKRPYLTWWVLGLTMFIFSLFLWPSPAVALIGAVLLPIAVKKGLTPLAAAIAMNLFGHGFALSWDLIIQGAPAITASAAQIETHSILNDGILLFLTMGIVTVISAFLLNRKNMINQDYIVNDSKDSVRIQSSESKDSSEIQTNDSTQKRISFTGKFIAIAAPIAFIGDIVLMCVYDIKGGDATSLVSGTAALIMLIGTMFEHKKKGLEKVTEYISKGFSFAIKIFAPVIIIGAFFFLGGQGASSNLGDTYSNGLLNDWALWIASITPLNKYVVALIQLVIGGLTGLDGSGFSGLPLVGSLAQTFGTTLTCSIPILASLGQISAIFIGGGCVVPWGLIPVAAICNVDPTTVARKNFTPVMIGFAATFIVACLLL